MKASLFLLLSAVSAFAQFGGESIRPWEPRDIRTKAGLFAQYDVGQASTVTLNGSGISKVADKSWVPGRLENLLVQSEAFSTTWARSQVNAFGATDTGATGAGSFANTARTLDPLGGNTADFVQEDGTGSSVHAIYQTVTSTLTDNVFDVYVKQGGRTWAYVCIDNPARLGAYFDVANGVVGTVDTGIIASISNAANGFYRCRITRTFGQTSANVLVLTASGNGTSSYNGDNTSGLFLWGAQLRRATSSSTYLATTTVAEDASRDLLQSTAANQPIYDTTNTLNGKATAYFDGSAHYLKTAGMASLVQPETVVFVGKQVTWTLNRQIFDGLSADSTLYQNATTPKIRWYAGSNADENAGWAVGSYSVIRGTLSGNPSSLTVNNGAAVAGNAGANNPAGFTLGASRNANAWANIQVQHILLFNQVLATPELNYVCYGGLRDVGALP